VPRPLTKEEREQFLSELHVGVLTIADGSRGPLVCPVWYTYEPGGVIVFCTKKDARKVRLLREGARVSFLVQIEGELTAGVLPMYVAVEGPVVKLETADMDRDLRPIMHRYLGPAVADAYLQSTRGDSAEGEVVVQIRPERWLTRTFGA
jgi:nitroimidazol reductase NimA-like FMN-containing flavoprotein (pyridoxamine 5'-phosphate oxidase superfamily)